LHDEAVGALKVGGDRLTPCAEDFAALMGVDAGKMNDGGFVVPDVTL
jgi:hypothetical protein